MRFLIVEDDPHVAEAARLLLERRGHSAQVWMDALSAVEAVCEKRPDAVLLDIMMPGMDGVEICRRLHSRPDLQRLHKIMVTGKSYAEDAARAIEAGADGVILKPIDPRTFVDEILALADESVVLSFWAFAAGIPVPGAKSARHGGNTCCVSIELPQERRLILDAGTGIKALSDAIAAEWPPHIAARIFISHPHRDHIGALPYFAPLFERGNEIEILGPDQCGVSTGQLVATQFDPLHSCVTLADLGARVTFRDLSEGTYSFGSYRVRTLLLAHPGNCLGYRIEYKNRAICYVADTELLAWSSPRHNEEFERKLGEFLAGADVAIVDSKTGRRTRACTDGHVDVARLAEVAHLANVGELMLYHHDPDEDDAAIDAKLEVARVVLARSGSRTSCTAPAEGTRRALPAVEEARLRVA